MLIRPLLLCLTVISAAAQPDAAESAKVVHGVQAWLKLPRDKRPAIPDDIAKAALTKADAATLAKAFWEDRVALLKVERAEEMKAKVLTHGDKKMKYDFLKFGGSVAGQPLFISMHGGGEDKSGQINEQQWRNQLELAKKGDKGYKPKAGIYVAPRGPTNSWDLWHQAHIDPLFDRLIEDMVAVEGVDPNRVYLMGYSAGDGVYQLAPRMADRLAAASMMAGHPNSVSCLGLRNLPFTIHVGANDTPFNRNKVAAEYGQKLDDLQKADPGGYEHWVHVHEGCAHWMNMEDKEAIPWMEKFTRNAIPDKIVWHQSGTTHDHFYWLAVPKAEAKGGQDITAERKGQSITIGAKTNPHVTVLLNDTVLDMDQPVTVTWNGKTLEPRRVDRTVAVIRRTMEERGDPFLTFSAEIALPPP